MKYRPDEYRMDENVMISVVEMGLDDLSFTRPTDSNLFRSDLYTFLSFAFFWKFESLDWLIRI